MESMASETEWTRSGRYDCNIRGKPVKVAFGMEENLVMSRKADKLLHDNI